jgi:peptidoglycan/xylan/chitin deacetylase (PgdA/CDA1 family)
MKTTAVLFRSLSILALAASAVLPGTASAATAKVALTFDDGLGSHHSAVAPMLAATGHNATFYIATGLLGTAEHMTWTQVQSLHAQGFEIGGHSVTHAELPEISIPSMQQEIKGSYDALIAKGITPKAFATPYGAYNQNVLAEVAKYYESHRGFHDINLNGFPYNKYLLQVRQITSLTTVAQVETWIDEAEAGGHWLILVFHDILPSGQAVGDYGWTTQNLQALLDSLNARSIKAKTVSEIIGDYTNLLANGDFDNGIANGWSTDQPSFVAKDTTTKGAVSTPLSSIKFTGSASTAHLFSPKAGVSSANEYGIRFFTNTQGLSAGELSFYVDEYDANGNWLSWKWLGAAGLNEVIDQSYLYKPTSSGVAFSTVNAYFAAGSVGTAFLDAVEFFSTSETQTNPVPNPNPNPNPTSTRPSCPFTAKANRTVVNFPSKRLVSNGDHAAAFTSVSAHVGAGTYTVQLAAWDGYPERISVTQPHEQYFVKLQSGNTDLVTTNPTSDVPDFLASASVVETVNTGFVVPQGVDTVAAKHAYWPDTSSPNSLEPICVAFDKKVEEPPACDSKAKATGWVESGNATLVVPAGACPMTVSFSSYQHTGTVQPYEEQVLIDNITGTYGPGTHRIGPLNLACNWQADLYYGTVLEQLGANGHGDLYIASDAKENQVCEPPPPEDPKECPFLPTANRTVIKFNGTKIVSHEWYDGTVPYQFSVDASVPAGTYRVSLASYDGYAGRESVSQPKEQYLVKFMNNSSILATSGATTDLQDNVFEANWSGVVNETLTLNADANRVNVFHAAYQDFGSPNSVQPVCVALEKLNGSSYILSGDFQNGFSGGWTNDNSNRVKADVSGKGAAPNAGSSISLGGGASAVHLFSPRVSVPSGQMVSVSMYANTSGVTAGELGFYLDEFDANGNWVSGKWLGAADNGTAKEYQYSYVPTSGAVTKISLQTYFTFTPSGTAYVDNALIY